MLNNIFTTDNQEILRFMGELVLNEEQLVEVSKITADAMTIDKTEEMVSEFVANVLDENELALYADKDNKQGKIDLTLWIARMAYIYGHRHAMERYSATIQHSIIESAVIK